MIAMIQKKVSPYCLMSRLCAMWASISYATNYGWEKVMPNRRGQVNTPKSIQTAQQFCTALDEVQNEPTDVVYMRVDDVGLKGVVNVLEAACYD